jgi:hypothetical protein
MLGTTELVIRFLSPLKQSDPHFALLHEIGHYVDNLTMVEGNDKSNAIRFPDFFATHFGSQWQVNAVSTCRILASHDQNEAVAVIQYWNQLHETWARAYAQFVTCETQNEFLKEDLDFFLEVPNTKVQWLYLWRPDQFEAYRRTIRQELSTLGWLIQ